LRLQARTLSSRNGVVFMFSELVHRGLQPVRRVVQALLAHDASNQLAAGFALGMVLGLVPKGNLIAVSLFVLLFSLRVNTGIGLIAALAFSWCGSVLDPVADKLGAYMLANGSLQTTYASLFQLPFGPWFEFNNTVVVGSLAIGLWAMYPTYWLSYQTFEWNRRRAHEAAAARCHVIDAYHVDSFHVDESILREPRDRRAA
jgi:uncharacterized protein (TIGR03546 family)